MRGIATWVTFWVAAVCVASPAFSAITIQSYYRLGEDDAGATSGGAGNSVTIGRNASGVSSPTLDLTKRSAPTYTNALATAAVSKTGSTLGMSFNGASGYGRGTPVITAQDNYGLEAWFKWTSGSGVIAVNGDSGGNGYALLVSGGTYQALYGGVAFLDSGVTADTNWHNLAVVRTSGTSRLYLDGTQIGGTFSNTPNTPSSGFGIGENNAGNAFFTGSVDEVRLFTFTAGQFSTSDLLANATPEPGMAGVLVLAGGLGLLTRRRRERPAIC